MPEHSMDNIAREPRSPRRRMIVGALSLVALGAAANAAPPKLSSGLGAENIPVTFQTAEGWTYDGRIELPPKDRRRPWAVMLLGGGDRTPIDWLVAGALTIDGKPTRDADTIARALLDAGFIVMRWQAIRRSDPKHAKDPLTSTAPPYAQTVEQARKALAAFRAKKVVADDHIFLLGRSLGVRRATVLVDEDENLPGVVMLAGALLLPTYIESVRDRVTDASFKFQGADTDRDGFIDQDEWRVYRRNFPFEVKLGGKMSRLDLDGDETLSSHEWVVDALHRRPDAWRKMELGPIDEYGHRWVADVIAARKTPTLLLVGSLDERWLLESYVMAWRQRVIRHPDYEWKVYEDAGHNLGPELAEPVIHAEKGKISKTRTGPISPDVVEHIVSWLEARAGGARE